MPSPIYEVAARWREGRSTAAGGVDPHYSGGGYRPQRQSVGAIG